MKLTQKIIYLFLASFFLFVFLFLVLLNKMGIRKENDFYKFVDKKLNKIFGNKFIRAQCSSCSSSDSTSDDQCDTSSDADDSACSDLG